MNLNATLLAQAVVFAVFIWLTAKLIWPHLTRAIEARQKTIADGLAAAEAGIVGMFLFGIAVYCSLKVPLAIWFGKYDVDATVQRFAPALAIGMCGAVTGILFLSWAYKDILYMFFGASAALYAAARAQDPRVRIRASLKEVALVASGMIALLVLLYVLARVRG